MSGVGNFRELPQGDWTQALAREVRRIRCWPFVDLDGLSVEVSGAGLVQIRFVAKTDELIEPRETPILDQEPVSLVYPSLQSFGVDAPSVWSARGDFPRDIGHINSTPAGQPASICLARAGHQAVYDRRGVDGILDRLQAWFHDAKTGQLMLDGWEPVPMGDGQRAGGAFFDIGFFQMMAKVRSNGGDWCCGIARLLTDDLGGRVVFLKQEVDLTNKEQVQGACIQIQATPKNKAIATHIPWVFAWTARGAPIDRQLFGVWNTYGDIEAGVRGTGVETLLPTAIIQTATTLAKGKDGKCNRPIGLLLGVWRPKPILKDVPGLAQDPDARNLEIRAYLLDCHKHQDNPIDPSVEARNLTGIQLPTCEVLNVTSGISVSAPVALFGYGALGSCIGDFLVRMGIPKIAAFDKDELAPHNLARHTATIDDLADNKVAHLNKLAGKVTFLSSEIQREVCSLDLASLSDNELWEITAEYRLIIDATADERVRRRLTRAALPAGTRLVRVEMFDRGKLGVLFVTGPGNSPNLVDLYYALCAQALEHSAIERWLHTEQANGASAEELVLGMGCASATTRMPKFTVAQHASAFMPVMLSVPGENHEAGFGINPLAENGTPAGCQWIGYGGVPSVIEASGATGWQVRLSPQSNARLTALREAHGMIETGGYLYGGYDFVLKHIYVVAVSDEPPSTVQSRSALKLGPAGRTRLERRIDRRAAGKLARVGTWHSHPGSGPEMSARDRKTMRTFIGPDQANGVPTLLVISSPSGNGAHLWV